MGKSRGVCKRDHLVYGVGINDADYEVYPRVDGKVFRCPYYATWISMLGRCYSDEFQDRQPTYKGCSVHPDWISFMNFRKWMMKQDWQGKALDKDLLVKGNKVYSPSACVFVDAMTNTFTIDCGRSRGEYPLGVNFHKHRGKFQANCRNPFTNKKEYLGLFTCEHQAHLAWRKRKHELACKLAESQTDARVAEALRRMYLPE